MRAFVGALLICAVVVIQCRAAPPGWLSERFDIFKHSNLSSTPPSKDPFYRFGDIGALHNGEIIAKRSVKSQTYVQSSDLADAVQVQYRTTAADDKPDATLATIFVPKAPVHPARILAAQIFSDSAAVDCASSWSLIQGSKSMANTFDTLQTLIILRALKHGWYISVADFEGSKAAFNSRAEGRAVLDGVRALLSDRKLLPDAASAQIVLSGYSGGAHATASAVQQAAKYAPELNIVGASFGGTPIDPRTTLNKLNGGENSYFALAGLVGLMNAYPEVDAFLAQRMYANGTDAVATMRRSCYIDTYKKWKSIDVFSYTPLGRGLLDDPVLQKYLAQETIGKDEHGQPDAITAFPMHIYHATKDPMIPFESVIDFVNTQCEHGASIEFDTDRVPTHSGELFKGMAGNFDWIKDCFDGKHANADHCTRRDSFF